MPRTCHACGRHLKPHRHGKRNHCSSQCARLLTRFEKDRKRSGERRDPVPTPR